MEKMFIHIAKKASFTPESQAKYINSIVFIKDTLEIWTHGTFYAIPDTYKDKITNLESAVKALQQTTGGFKYFSKLSDGTKTFEAAAANSTITVTGAGSTTVAASANGFTVTGKELTETGTSGANGTVTWGGSEVKVKGLGSAAYTDSSAYGSATATKEAKDAADAAQRTANTAVANAATAQEKADANGAKIDKINNTLTDHKSLIDAKVASVNSGSTAISVGGTATAPTVGLAISTANKGNVTLTQATDGLSASVTIPAATVTGINASDKVLSLTNKLIGSEISVDYVSEDKKIYLYGKATTATGEGIKNGKYVLGTVDTADFVKDGMIKSAVYNDNTHRLVITFNTDAGAEPIDINLSSLVDVYDGANLKLSKSYKAAASYSAPAAADSTDTAIAKLAKGHDENLAKINTLQNATHVDSLGGQTGAITVKGDNTSNGTINLAVSTGKVLSASIVGLKSAAFTESSAYATAAQGGKADSAVQTVREANTGTYISVAAAKSGTTINLTPSVTVLAVATAGDNKGLAEASDVKAYVDNLFAWEEL